MNGSPTLFTGWLISVEPMRESELVRAALLGDIALVVMTVAWLVAARRQPPSTHVSIWLRRVLRSKARWRCPVQSPCRSVCMAS